MALPRKGHINSKKVRRGSLLGKWGGGGKRRRVELSDLSKKHSSGYITNYNTVNGVDPRDSGEE